MIPAPRILIQILNEIMRILIRNLIFIPKGSEGRFKDSFGGMRQLTSQSWRIKKGSVFLAVRELFGRLIEPESITADYLARISRNRIQLIQIFLLERYGRIFLGRLLLMEV